MRANPPDALPFTIFHISTALSSQPVVTFPPIAEILTFLNLLWSQIAPGHLPTAAELCTLSIKTLRCTTTTHDTPCVNPKSFILASLRRSTMPSEAQMAKFMYYIVKQLDVRSVSPRDPRLLPALRGKDN